MRRHLRLALPGLLLALGGAGCNSFLDAENATFDPNAPTQATRDQLFVAAQVAMFGLQEANVAQFSCVILQHCSGTGNYVEGYAQTYTQNSTTFDADFNLIFTGGGLVDLRTIQSSATEAGNLPYAGMAKVIEAVNISFAADNWGDIPYTDIRSGSSTPSFDKQFDVYDSLQVVLDQAITDLGGAGDGPSSALDFVYGGDKTKWIRAAYTLKARIHMHTAEVRGTSAYQAAIAAAQLGISDTLGDFRALHGTATSERNLWYQFAFSTFGQYLKAGSTLVNIMEARSDPRLPDYFSEIAPGDYEGFDIITDAPATVSEVTTVPPSTRITDTYRQPIITYEENQLILAEANFQVAGAAAAQPFLDAARALHGLPSVPATLQQIAEEQYVAYFQNVEAWQSYKRTCYPNLVPSDAVTPARIPARLFYGDTELNANPNTPSEAEQVANGGGGFRNGGAEPTGSTAAPARNPNDPPGGTVNPAGSCLGQP